MLPTQVQAAIRELDSDNTRQTARRPVRFGILAADESLVDEILEFLFPPPLRVEHEKIVRIASESDSRRVDVGFSEPGWSHPPHSYDFDRQDPRLSADRLIDDSDETLWLPLAAQFPGFRRAVSEKLIMKIAIENTLFAAATSLPNVVPTPLGVPWIVGEFASDMVVLTVNQVRLCFLLAAAHGYNVGADRQFAQIGSIVGTAFGWRGLARLGVSKLPAGAGVAAKALIAFAGTYAVGRGLELWFREGRKPSRAAWRKLYEDATVRGRAEVQRVVGRLRLRSQAAEEAA